MNNFSLLIRKWYRLNKRDLPWRNTEDPYHIWLSEIILQQTRVDQGLSYYTKFITNYPTIESLANASEQQVLNDWQGLGYYSRARNLQFAANQIIEEFNGVFPNNFKDIKSLKGIGDYTAAAIASFSYGENKAVVDGNVYRVLSRVFAIDTPIDCTEGKKEFQTLANELLSEEAPGEHNQAIMEMGALVCTPKSPKCDLCPISSICASYPNEWQNRPTKSKKVKIRNRYFHFLIANDNGAIILEKRTNKDIWQNMFQPPLFETDTNIEFQFKHNINFVSNEVKHILSHQNIFAKFYHTNDSISLKKEWHKIKLSDLEDYPLPRLIDKYFEDNLMR